MANNDPHLTKFIQDADTGIMLFLGISTIFGTPLFIAVAVTFAERGSVLASAIAWAGAVLVPLCTVAYMLLRRSLRDGMGGWK